MKKLLLLPLSMLLLSCSITTKVPAVQSYKIKSYEAKKIVNESCNKITLEISNTAANNIYFNDNMYYISDENKANSFALHIRYLIRLISFPYIIC